MERRFAASLQDAEVVFGGIPRVSPGAILALSLRDILGAWLLLEEAENPVLPR